MKKILILIAFLLLSVSKVFPIGPLERNAIRSEIKNRLENILKKQDEGAVVDVTLSIDDKVSISNNVKYENPFLLSNANDSSESFNLKVKGVGVTIFSSFTKSQYPVSVMNRLNIILKEYTNISTIHFEKIVANEKGFFAQVGSLNFFQFSLVVLLTLSLVTLLLLKFLDIYSTRNRGPANDMARTISDGINSLKNSLDGLAHSGRPSGLEYPQVSSPLNLEINTGNEFFMKDFSIEVLNELLMDCYWCKEDEYAAYVWSKLDILRKGRLLTHNRRLGDYATFISTVDGLDKKYINETYYFNPLIINGIPNDNLTELVEKHNSVFHLLSKLRISNLKITASEKKNLMRKKYNKKDTENEFQTIKWDEYITTEIREFESGHVFYFESISEEKLFFQDPNVDFSLVSAFPSLTWLVYLSKEEVLEILSPFTAKELSTAWDGPTDTLKKLESFLPVKKVELLKSYCQKTMPNRKSDIFKHILSRAADKLKGHIEQSRLAS